MLKNALAALQALSCWVRPHRANSASLRRLIAVAWVGYPLKPEIQVEPDLGMEKLARPERFLTAILEERRQLAFDPASEKFTVPGNR